MQPETLSEPDLLYGDLAFLHTHPSHLAAVAALCGLSMPPVENARVLEIGCGTGFNLLAMSQSLPSATFVGVDLSAPQIAHGRALAEQMGATNVALHVGRLEELPHDIGEFDYIVAHGLFSWVPEHVRSAVLGLMRDRLTPNGLGYLSYNVYPGWHFRSVLRDFMRFMAPSGEPGRDRVRRAKDAAHTLIQSAPDSSDLYIQVLQSELAALNDGQDYYIFHEHLCSVNQPFYFTEIAQLLADHRLQYVSESRYGTSAFAQLGDDQRALDAAGPELIRREQYHDFRWQRYFRQSIVTNVDRAITRQPDAAAVARCWLSPRVDLVDPADDPSMTPTDRVRREEDGAEFEVHDPLYRNILRVLHGATGRKQSFAALRQAFVKQLEVPLQPTQYDAILTKAVTKGVVEELWHIYAVEPRYATSVGETPRVCPLVAHQAAQESVVTNRLHRITRLTDADRTLIALCDGRTSQDSLATAMGVDRASLLDHLQSLANGAVFDS